MVFELPASRNRREILSAPALLQIESEGLGLSLFTRSLLVFVLCLFYVMFFYGCLHNILGPKHDKGLIIPFIGLAIPFSALLVPLIKMITKQKGNPLIFTEIGITGPWLMGIKYEKILYYGWEFCGGFLATGRSSKQLRKTLVLKGKGGFAEEIRFKDRFGNSIFGTYGYFLDDSQIAIAEEIFKKAGVDKDRISIN